MNNILTIVLLVCGVGAAYSHRVRKRSEAIPASEYVDALSLTETHPLNATHVELQTSTLTDHFERNERLVNVMVDTLKNLASSANDPIEKQKFTLMTLFFIHYFNAETGSAESDLIQAIKKTFAVLHKPAHVLSAPVRTVVGKFVSAVANRIGHVQDLCSDKKYCKHTVLARDSAESSKCPEYHHHALLHNLAMDKVSSVEKIFNVVKQVASKGITSTLLSTAFDMGKALLDGKSIFRVLKSYVYPCSNVGGASDYAA